MDAEGRPATTIRQFLEGGGLLPFGGHKGYALALLVELICGALTGAGVPVQPLQAGKPRGLGFGGNSAFMVVLDISHFTDEEQFYTDVDGLFDRLEAVKPAPGFSQVMIPGAPEIAQRGNAAGKASQSRAPSGSGSLPLPRNGRSISTISWQRSTAT